MVFHDGDDVLAPGLVGAPARRPHGRDAGRAGRDRWGALVLASDATHYYENFESGRPFPIVFDVDAMVRGWGTLRSLASEPSAIVPGHDPLVLERYPEVSRETQGVAVRLDTGRI